MRVVEARPVPLLSPGLVKMEERKRPAPHEHADSAPPLKKQATSVNGGGKSHPDAEMPWKDELEVSLVWFIPPPLPSPYCPAHHHATPSSHYACSNNFLMVLQRFQKDAIWRQMQEYKRERNTLESRLSELTKRTAYHDDHVRIIDAWFKQVRHRLRLRCRTDPRCSSLTHLDF